MGDSHQTLLVRVGAIVFVAIAITALVLGFADRKPAPAVTQRKAMTASDADPLRSTLRHCQRMGEAAASEPDCIDAWATSRDRFLGRSSTIGR